MTERFERLVRQWRRPRLHSGDFAAWTEAMIARGFLLAMFLLGMTLPAVAVIPASERAALMNLYTSTNGASWTKSTNWNGAVGTECSWFGIECDGYGAHVQAIRLGWNNLAGTLPSLSALPKLYDIDVSENQLTGSIPSLSVFTDLQWFRAEKNQLSGSIPPLGGLTSLEWFYVNQNRLTGSIPSLSGLTALVNFAADGNQLSGSIPSLAGLGNLTYFNVSNNRLTGSIPSLNGLSSLYVFDVSQNNLTGSFPSQAGANQLRFIFASDNRLTGSITLQANLVGLVVSNNNFTGPVPDAPSGLMAGQSNLCGNGLNTSGNAATDAAWVTAQNPSVVAGGRWLQCQRPTCTLTASPTSIFPGQSATLTAACTPMAASYSWSANTGLGGVSVPSVTVFPAATTTYSVIGSNAFGSGSEATVTVTVTTSYAPVCTLTAAPGWISSGTFTTLRASCNPPATSYIWTGGFCAGTTGANCTVHPTMTTAYSVQGVNGEMLSAAATVTVRVVPTVPFPLSVSSSVGPSTTTVTASIAARSQDIGITTNIYVFAVAPPALVKAGRPGDGGFPPLGYAKRADGIKDASVACVLAQLNSSGELKQVTASSMQAYVTGVLTDQWRAVEVINGVATANIAGATFYVGYGTSASAMLNNGMHSSVVVIGAARTCQPQAPQTGWWWNPNEGGRGYSIESRGSNLVMTAYLYDITGRATWHWAGGPTMLDGSVFTGPLMSFGTGVTLTGAYQANTRLPDAGTITLTFDDATHGTLVWPGGTVAIQRYAFGASGVDTTPLANQPESGWWWGGTGDNGRGFFIEWQGARAFIAGYMYDAQGNAIWYVADSPVTNAQTFTGSWLQFANGQTLAGTYRPAALVNGNVAPVTIQFQGAENAILTLPSGTLPLMRFRF